MKIKELICNIGKKRCKEAEIAFKLEEQYIFIQKNKKKSVEENNKKKGPERPKQSIILSGDKEKCSII